MESFFASPLPNCSPRPENEPFGPHGLGSRPCKKVTAISDRLCISDDEESFVEALVVHVTHKRDNLKEDGVKMTDDQVRQIAVDRRGADWRPWDKRQIERLKGKYVSRPGRPGSRCELLKMLSRGVRGIGKRPGTPSVYETTGIERLLPPRGRRPVLAPAA